MKVEEVEVYLFTAPEVEVSKPVAVAGEGPNSGVRELITLGHGQVPGKLC